MLVQREILWNDRELAHASTANIGVKRPVFLFSRKQILHVRHIVPRMLSSMGLHRNFEAFVDGYPAAKPRFHYLLQYTQYYD